MYWYYFQSARGVRIWWKEWVTRFQIIQFIIDLGKTTYLYADLSNNCKLTLIVQGFVYFASYTYFTSSYFPWMPNAGTCAGEEFAAFAGMGILSSYLVLFISFYLATYKKGDKKTTRKSLRRMSQAPLPDPLHMQAIAKGAANGSSSATSTGAKPNGTKTRSRKA